MGYSENHVHRIREILPGNNVDERKMFGGVVFMVDGHMCVGVDDVGLAVRVGTEAYEKALNEEGVRPFDRTGRALSGFVYVDFETVKTKRQLVRWVNQGTSFVATLPPKKPKAKTKTKKKITKKRKNTSPRS